MADVTIKYNDSTIAELNGTGSKTLNVSGKYCEADVEVVYAPRSKIYSVTVPTAVASQFVTLVTGDADVAAHYADENAMVTVRKITNNDTVGTAFIAQTNHSFGAGYGYYMNYNKTVNAAAVIPSPMTQDSSGVPYVMCTEEGDIMIYAQRTNNNFGGADYIVTFSW